MLASFADYAKKKDEQKSYEEMKVFFCESISQSAIWTLTSSITNNVKQMMFSSSDAQKMVTILCTLFGIRSAEVQYFMTFSSTPSLRKKSKPSNILKFTSKEDCHRKNNERLINGLCTALREKTIEYRQALELVIQILEHYPEAEKCLQG